MWLIIIRTVVDYRVAMASAIGKRWLRGVVLYTGTEVIPFAGNLHGLPLSVLWGAHR